MQSLSNAITWQTFNTVTKLRPIRAFKVIGCVYYNVVSLTSCTFTTIFVLILYEIIMLAASDKNKHPWHSGRLSRRRLKSIVKPSRLMQIAVGVSTIKFLYYCDRSFNGFFYFSEMFHILIYYIILEVENICTYKLINFTELISCGYPSPAN